MTVQRGCAPDADVGSKRPDDKWCAAICWCPMQQVAKGSSLRRRGKRAQCRRLLIDKQDG